MTHIYKNNIITKIILIGGGVFISSGAFWLFATEFKKNLQSIISPKQSSFSIVTMGDLILRIENATGSTWVLQRRMSGRLGWQFMPEIGQGESGQDINIMSATKTLSAAMSNDATQKSMPTSFQLHSILTKVGYTAIELDMLRSGYLTCKCSIDNNNVIMMIDTGAPTTHLDRKQTSPMGISWTLADKTKGIGDVNKSSEWIATVKAIRIGELFFNNLLLGEWDLSNINDRLQVYRDPPISGIIGADLLRPKSAVIDYKARMLYLKN